MPNPVPQLSFGTTSVAELVTAVRQVVDPAPSVNWEQLATHVATHVEQLVQANSQLVRDVPSEQWLRTCCVVLATYRALNPYLESM